VKPNDYGDDYGDDYGNDYDGNDTSSNYWKA
jgi:hypothetical protein